MMNKQDFLQALRDKLSSLHAPNIEEQLHFYCQKIDSQMQNGLTEEKAVAALGSADEIAKKAVSDLTVPTENKPPHKEKSRRSAWMIVLIVLGSPLWVALLLAALSVLLSLYITLWALLVSLWAVFGSLCGCAIGGVLGGIVFACKGNFITGIAAVGGGMVLAGLAIFLFFGSRSATNGTLLLTRRVAQSIIKPCKQRGKDHV